MRDGFLIVDIIHSMEQVEARLLLGDCREELKKLADNSPADFGET